ncbi:uncharacterized protein L3040_009134 [Drepanopeziza brunnea f. sp. 'multigermtubi']|uniref:uncharacterized protein n=1 Tax=Drepanopeziza brunnea f. sp. 'multigermtubi' TaxID=698441 RepID=UPI00238EDE89|nr:hypothetical protein L3040_009134 [Drepanopeziza brunnea f. sp. 'multigermtubi']
MKAAFVFAAVVSALTGFANATPYTFPVCIVGAGPAGLLAAKKLEAKGKKVVVFEKRQEVGGKCQAVYDQGGDAFHPLGALLFSNASYPETLKVLDVAGVPAIPYIVGQRWVYNITTGFTVQSPPVPAAFATLVAQEFQRYSDYWTAVFAPYTAIGYKNGVPAELAVTTAEWLATNNYQALPTLFVPAMLPFGYGDLREIPILYMLQYLTPDILGFFAQRHGIYLIDFHKVFVNYAKSIRGPIHLRTTITKIDRNGRFPIITYQNSGNNGAFSIPKIQLCSSLILAFPPTVPALEAAKLTLTPAESEVFSPIQLISYFSSAVHLQTPRNFTFAAENPAPSIPVTPTGAPISFVHLFRTSDIATAWSWGSNTSLPTARTLLKQTLSRINKDPRDSVAVAKVVTDADIVGLQQNDYFPHFGPQELRNGWYGKFNALQGSTKTYFASGLNAFETVEFAIRAGIDVVDSYF